MSKSTYTHDAVATIGSYTDRQTGESKKQFLTVGKGFTDDQGRISVLLQCLPLAQEWSRWITLYPAKDRSQPTSGPSASARPSNAVRGMPAAPQSFSQPSDDDDDIPF